MTRITGALLTAILPYEGQTDVEGRQAAAFAVVVGPAHSNNRPLVSPDQLV